MSYKPKNVRYYAAYICTIRIEQELFRNGLRIRSLSSLFFFIVVNWGNAANFAAFFFIIISRVQDLNTGFFDFLVAEGFQCFCECFAVIKKKKNLRRSVFSPGESVRSVCLIFIN